MWLRLRLLFILLSDSSPSPASWPPMRNHTLCSSLFTSPSSSSFSSALVLLLSINLNPSSPSPFSEAVDGGGGSMDGGMEGWMWLQPLFEKRSGDFYSSSFFSFCQLKCMMGRSPVFLAASSEQETCQGQTAERAQTLRFVRSHFKKTQSNTTAFHFFAFTPEPTADFCEHVHLL